jgi:hypothetical protein
MTIKIKFLLKINYNCPTSKVSGGLIYPPAQPPRPNPLDIIGSGNGTFRRNLTQNHKFFRLEAHHDGL